MDHAEVTGDCYSCHNGQTATGKPPNHIDSSNNCDACHRTTAWIPATMDQEEVMGDSNRGHNGQTTTNKQHNHTQQHNESL